MPEPRLFVVAGVLENAQGDICLAQRPAHAHQGGLWEFPGGKREPGETAFAALQREFAEELGVQIVQARPLIHLQHDYPDKSILLDVWRIQTWQGKPWGKEGQVVRWVAKADLRKLAFPAANQAIIRAVELPDQYLITPEPSAADKANTAFLQALDNSLQAGIQLLQLRAKQLSADAYARLTQQVLRQCQPYAAQLLLNAAQATPAQVIARGAQGLQLTSTALHRYSKRPLPTEYWLAASCHTLADLQQAERVGTDFILLSPVAITASHPDSPPLGWDRFQQLAQQAHCPVYALGGMHPADRAQAQACGGQGIAAIRSLWREASL